MELAGLGARDTLRLEAGLCLYGHDIDTRVTPAARRPDLGHPEVRRPGGERAGGYPGAQVIDHQLVAGVPHKRVGLVGPGAAPVREGAQLVDAQGTASARHQRHRRADLRQADRDGLPGEQPRPRRHHEVYADVRGQKLPMRVHAMPSPRTATTAG